MAILKALAAGILATLVVAGTLVLLALLPWLLVFGIPALVVYACCAKDGEGE